MTSVARKTQSRLETNRKDVKLTVVLKSPSGTGTTMNLGLPGRAVVELYRKTHPCIKHKAILYKGQVSAERPRVSVKMHLA